MGLGSFLRSVLSDDEDAVEFIFAEISANSEYMKDEEACEEILKAAFSVLGLDDHRFILRISEYWLGNYDEVKAQIDSGYISDDDADESSENEVEILLDSNQCEMCERHMPLTFHHLFPKKVHKRFEEKRVGSEARGIPKSELRTCGIMICRQCHSHLHRTYDHDKLAKDLNSLDKIFADPKIIAFIQYARKQKELPKNHAKFGLKYRR